MVCISIGTVSQHYQCAIYFKNVRGFDAVRGMFRKHFFSNKLHLEVMRGSPRQAFEYCSKEDSRCPDVEPVLFGELPAGEGKRTDLDAVREMIVDGCALGTIADAHFGTFVRYHRGIQAYIALRPSRQRDFECITVVFWGPPGSGKSSRVRAVTGPGDLYVVTYPTQSGGPQYFDGYNSESTMLFDDFYGQVPRSTMLNICDRYAIRLPQRGSTCECLVSRVFITSNVDPAMFWKRRGLGGMARRFGLTSDVPRIGYVEYIGNDEFPTPEAYRASPMYVQLTGTVPQPSYRASSAAPLGSIIP